MSRFMDAILIITMVILLAILFVGLIGFGFITYAMIGTL